MVSLLFNSPSRFVIAFLPRSKCLLISWLQSPSAVILEPKKRISVTVPTLCVLVTQLYPTLWDPMDCSSPGSSVHGNSPGKNTGVGCHALLQGIFPTQGLNPGLLHCRWILYCLSHQRSPKEATRRAYLRCWYFSWKSWFQLVNLPAWHFPWSNGARYGYIGFPNLYRCKFNFSVSINS